MKITGPWVIFPVSGGKRLIWITLELVSPFLVNGLHQSDANLVFTRRSTIIGDIPMDRKFTVFIGDPLGNLLPLEIRFVDGSGHYRPSELRR